MATGPPTVICSGPRAGSRLAAPASSEAPHTERARSGMNSMGIQPLATSAAMATFFSPRAATHTGMDGRTGWAMILSGLPSPVP